jgi:hypothetical protein
MVHVAKGLVKQKRWKLANVRFAAGHPIPPPECRFPAFGGRRPEDKERVQVHTTG